MSRSSIAIVLAGCAASTGPTSPSATPDATTGDGTSTPDGQTGCTPQPLGAPNEQWSWIPVAGAKCGNGSSAGFAIQPTTRSKQVVFFLMGGGGCYSQQTCAQGMAANLNGCTPTTAGQELGMFQAGSIFDRNAAGNPFKDATWIFSSFRERLTHRSFRERRL